MIRSHTMKQAGFTLVELAIVLVIIGLIVGGVLVGQDLIRAAGIRSVVTDIERYNAAANTFLGKYNSLPGDMLNNKAVEFGFNTAANDAARDGAAGQGDGNGRISGCGHADATNLGCETILFWSDLSAAKLVPFRSAFTSMTATTPTDMTNAELVGSGLIPNTKLHTSTLVYVSTIDGKNLFALGEFFVNGGDGTMIMVGSRGRGFMPIEAVAIDQKLDDGNPITGSIVTIDRYIGILDTPDSGTGCATTVGGNDIYNTVTDELATTNACGIRIRASF